MENKEITTIIRLVGILGVIIYIVSLLTPWSSSAYGHNLTEIVYKQ